MSNSEFLEEILHDAHDLGIFDEVLDEVKKLRSESNRKYLDLTEVYETAIQNVKKKLKKID